MSKIFVQMLQILSDWAIPVLIFIILLMGIRKKLKVYEAFVDGAKEGFEIAVMIIPYLVAILVAIGMFRASGGMEFIIRYLAPLTDKLGVPAETLSVALMRPLSGSGSLGIITELLKTHGADSFIGRVASTMYGSTETTFYVIAVYFGVVNIKKTRHSVPAGLIADVIGLSAAVFICHVMFH